MEYEQIDEVFYKVDGVEEWDAEPAIAELIKDERVFVAGGAEKERAAYLFVICNDIFAWAVADGEDLPYSEIGTVLKMHRADKKWGTIKWCCRQRGMQPQAPVARDMRRDGAWDAEMDGLEPNFYDALCKKWAEERKVAGK